MGLNLPGEVYDKYNSSTGAVQFASVSLNARGIGPLPGAAGG